MLSQLDIDNMMLDLQAGKTVYLYYIAHKVELREDIIDEYDYKSKSKFNIIRLELEDINNAYFEYLNFIKNPNNYHEETEISYNDNNTQITNYYNASNDTETNKFFNSRMPSIIYGHRRQIYDTINHQTKIISDPSPVKSKYINTLEYGLMSASDALAAFNSGLLSWKYKVLDVLADIDGILYKYVTSDWYILDIKNFPRIEKPLICVNANSAYFTNLDKAFSYMEQLEA